MSFESNNMLTSRPMLRFATTDTCSFFSKSGGGEVKPQKSQLEYKM